MSTIKTFGDVDQRSLDQLKRCMDAGDAELGVLCADHHPGYSQPIGGAIAYESYVSPSGVGYDIGCGNKAAQTELTRADLDELGGVEAIMREITRRISFGMGVPAREMSWSVREPVTRDSRRSCPDGVTVWSERLPPTSAAVNQISLSGDQDSPQTVAKTGVRVRIEPERPTTATEPPSSLCAA